MVSSLRTCFLQTFSVLKQPRMATLSPSHGFPHQATQLLVPEKCASEGKCLKRFGVNNEPMAAVAAWVREVMF